MRQWRFAAALRDTIVKLVKTRLEVIRVPRPAHMRTKAQEFIDLLFTQRDHEWMYVKTKDGERVKGPLLTDLEALAAAVEFGSLNDSKLTHYCCVQEGSPEHLAGLRVGGPCCRDKEESLEKVVVPILTWVVHRPWEVSAVSRWTHVVTLLKKTVVGFLAQRVLPESLRALRVHWDIHDGVISALERMVAADANDFSSKNKLRLYRVCKALCPSEMAFEAAIVLNVLMCVDPLLFFCIAR